MSKRANISIPRMPVPKIQTPKPQQVKVQPIKAQPPPVVKVSTNTLNPSKGSVGGKTLIPKSIQNFTVDQLRGNGEQGRTIRELREIAKNRAKPPVNRIIKPPFVMPKKGNT